MKLTKTKLRRMIKEELKRALHETWGQSAPQGFDAPRVPDLEKHAVTGLEQGRQRDGEIYRKKGRDLKSRDPDATFARNSIKSDLTKRGGDVEKIGSDGYGLFMRLLGHLENNEVDEAVGLAKEMGAQDDGDLASELDMYT